MLNRCSVVIHPSQKIIKEVKTMKELLAAKIGWYNSKNSIAHITVNEFEAPASELEKIKKELSPYINSKNLNIMGYLSKHNLKRFWASIDICIFTAPFESFGRGMWESIYNGVPIASFNTSGFQDLKELISRKAFLQINEKSNLFHLSTENIFISTDRKI